MQAKELRPASNVVELSKFAPDEKLPPNNLDAEECILGGILFDPNAWGRVADKLCSEVFYVSAHREIFAAMKGLVEFGKPTTVISIQDWLERRGRLSQAGGMAKLFHLLDSAYDLANLEYYADMLNERLIDRRLIQLGDEIKRLGFEGSIETKDKLPLVEQRLSDVLALASDGTALASPDEAIVRLFNYVEEVQEGLVEPAIPTGFAALDAALDGGLSNDGQLLIVSGTSGTGKSAFVGGLAERVSEQTGHTSLIFSFEMTEKQYRLRLAAARSGIQLSDIKRKGGIPPHKQEQWVAALGIQSSTPLLVNDKPGLDLSTVCTLIRQLKVEKEATESPLTMVVIDHLQLFAEVRGGDEQQNVVIGKITNVLKDLAKELQIRIVLVAQLTKGIDSRSDKRPRADDLYGSVFVRQDAEIILLLHREELHNPDTQDAGICEVIIAKNRDGKPATVRLGYADSITRFYNLDKF